MAKEDEPKGPCPANDYGSPSGEPLDPSIRRISASPRGDSAGRVAHGIAKLHDFLVTAKRRVGGLRRPRRRMHIIWRRVPRRTIDCSARVYSAFRNANACYDQSK